MLVGPPSIGLGMIFCFSQAGGPNGSENWVLAGLGCLLGLFVWMFVFDNCPKCGASMSSKNPPRGGIFASKCWKCGVRYR